MLCSLPGASLIDMANGTKTAGSSLFSHGLKIAVNFCRFFRTRSCPGISPRRFVPIGTLRRLKLHIPRFHASMKARSFRCSSSSHKILRFCGSPVVAVMANTSPGDISHSDGHWIFKVQVLLQEQFSEKMRSFPYIQEVGKERKTGWISTLRDRKKE